MTIPNSYEGKKRWLAKHDNNECVMTECPTCGQSWAKQKVIRASQADIDEWQRVSNEEWRPLNDLEIFLRICETFLVFVVGAAAGFAAGWLFHNLTHEYEIGFWSLIVGAAVWFVVMFGWITMKANSMQLRQDNLKERRQHILMKYGDIPIENVGTINNSRKEFVLLPKQ